MNRDFSERRRRRSDNPAIALSYQLAACCAQGSIDAMVVADENGLPLASAGDSYACDEVAARVVLVGRKIKEFGGTLLGPGQHWDVQMTKVEIDGNQLLVCAVGGDASDRQIQLARGVASATRILAA